MRLPGKNQLGYCYTLTLLHYATHLPTRLPCKRPGEILWWLGVGFSISDSLLYLISFLFIKATILGGGLLALGLLAVRSAAIAGRCASVPPKPQ